MKPVIIISITVVFLFSSVSIYAQSQYDIPAWFKGVAGFWAEDKISDNEFGEGLSFLIDSGIIKVPKIQELENKIAQLEDENAELRKIKGIPRPEPPPTSPQESIISIQTDSSNYDEGDIVVVSGNVSEIIGNTPLTLQLFLDESLVDISQVTVAQDGSFSHTIIAEGSLWKQSGDYLIRASYGEGNIAETGFSFAPSSDIPEITAIFEVSLGSYSSFDVEYSIRGGNVQDMSIDRNDFSLTVVISSVSDGAISLDLPRGVIGAEKQDGKDDTFIILIDGIEVAYQESVVHSDSRVITINFEEGDSDIKILGTYIV